MQVKLADEEVIFETETSDSSGLIKGTVNTSLYVVPLSLIANALTKTFSLGVTLILSKENFSYHSRKYTYATLFV